MTDEPTVYLAGPVAHAPDGEGGASWRDRFEDRFGDRFNVLNPLSKYNVPLDDLRIKPGVSNPNDETAVGVDELVRNDKQMIEGADVVLVGYKPVRSVGTPMETMYAYERDIPVVLWDRDGDFDLSPWYKYHVDAALGSMDDAVEWIEEKHAAEEQEVEV
jgi:nucleoside 2-deoxyribosyltransferase